MVSFLKNQNQSLCRHLKNIKTQLNQLSLEVPKRNGRNHIKTSYQNTLCSWVITKTNTHWQKFPENTTFHWHQFFLNPCQTTPERLDQKHWSSLLQIRVFSHFGRPSWNGSTKKRSFMDQQKLLFQPFEPRRENSSYDCIAKIQVLKINNSEDNGSYIKYSMFFKHCACT